MTEFKHEDTKMMMRAYIARGIEMTPEMVAVFKMRDEMLDLPTFGAEFFARFEQIEATYPGVLAKMADIETDFLI